jgi:hypothetical protein
VWASLLTEGQISLKQKAQALWSWTRGQRPVLVQARQSARVFFLGPLSEAEYGLLQRASAIIRTALAVGLMWTAGIAKVIIVIVLCLALCFVLHKITRIPSQGGVSLTVIK